MMATLIVLPLIASLLMGLKLSIRIQYVLIGLVWLTLSAVSAGMMNDTVSLSYAVPDVLGRLISVADALLLLFFLYQGIVRKSRPVVLLGSIQLLLYGWAESHLLGETQTRIVIDELSRFMFLIINGVGGAIVFYAIAYLRHENLEEGKKRLFIVYFLLFLAIMNTIVVIDSLMQFFFLFEMTTLASFVLIAFRQDRVAIDNALRALWMNQIGGIAILAAVLSALYGSSPLTLHEMIASGGGWVSLGAVCIAAAALIKGAMIPFERWLLGAMVAPTPVSAMLHSATMVKLSPFVILKLSPLLAGTPGGAIIAIAGGLCFAAAAYLALSRTWLKEILGYSTIALLGLMAALATLGNIQSLHIVMALMGFHALSKALLFLSAGVLEKNHGLKYVDDMAGLVEKDPKSAFFIIFGFVSLTLPPFGLFVGKLLAIESVASQLPSQPWLIVLLLSLLIGSVLLVLLYFKIASALLSAPSDILTLNPAPMEKGFMIPMALLSLAIIGIAVWFTLVENALYLFLPAVLMLAALYGKRSMERLDRVKTYQCGESAPFETVPVRFEASARLQTFMAIGFASLFILLIASGVLS